MPRFRLRLATLGLLIVIIALAVALVVQQRRETALNAHIQALEADSAVLQRVHERLIVTRQRQIDELRSKIARPSGEGKDVSRSVGPKD